MAVFIKGLFWPLLALTTAIVMVLATPHQTFAQEFDRDQRQRLEDRITEGAILNNNVVNEILSLTKCPSGQVAVRDRTNLRSGVEARYDEHPDRSRYRYPTRYGYDQDFQLSNNNRVRANARTHGRRSVTCVASHLLSQQPPSR